MVDVAIIHIKAGDGGRGSDSFRREKYIPKGGPDGGDGGNGGSVYLDGETNLRTLDFFASHQKFAAEDGDIGRKRKQHGSKGEDLHIKVPLGSVIYRVNGLDEDRVTRPEVYQLLRDYRDYATKDLGSVFETLSQEELPVTLEFMGEILAGKQDMKVAQGGTGGRGNVHFKSPSNQTPEEFEYGEPGEEIWLVLELKLLADVGLIGLPNRGKSTLISVLTAAKPKIADYEFTTLEPNLGVMKIGEPSSASAGENVHKELILSDIPGLIEGASEGRGLGDEFLRHVERCRTLVHVLALPAHLIDADQQTQLQDLVTSYEQIRRELENFSADLAEKPEIIVLNKIDLLPQTHKALSQVLAEELDLDILPISAATHQNLDVLRDQIIKLASK